jgi:hypothetical protein
MLNDEAMKYQKSKGEVVTQVDFNSREQRGRAASARPRASIDREKIMVHSRLFFVIVTSPRLRMGPRRQNHPLLPCPVAQIYQSWVRM